MKFRYTRYTGEDLEGLDLEELVSKLSKLLLSSGFNDPSGRPFDDEQDDDDDGQGHSAQALHDAILEALLSGGMLSDDTVSRLLGDPADADQEAGHSPLEELIQQIIERMTKEGFITPRHGSATDDGEGTGSGRGSSPRPARFELTDKGIDFLGYRALRDLLGSLGKSSVGRHHTRDVATGVEASGSSKPYEFGDTLNIDPSGTILNAVERLGAIGEGGAIDVQYEDVMVAKASIRAPARRC
jgi:Ca-activated chloride channel family protein